MNNIQQKFHPQIKKKKTYLNTHYISLLRSIKPTHIVSCPINAILGEDARLFHLISSILCFDDSSGKLIQDAPCGDHI
jgi:hypothetical protein